MSRNFRAYSQHNTLGGSQHFRNTVDVFVQDSLITMYSL
jgi:hypothetical protein